MTHDGFCNATEGPAFDTGTAVAAHRNEVIRNRAREPDDLVRAEPFFDLARDFLNTESLELGALFFQVFARFIPQFGDKLIEIGNVVTVDTGVSARGQIVSAEQQNRELQ